MLFFNFSFRKKQLTVYCKFLVLSQMQLISGVKQLKKQQSTGIYLSVNIRGQTAQEIAIRSQTAQEIAVNRYLSITINVMDQTAQEIAIDRYLSIYQYQGSNCSRNSNQQVSIYIYQYQGSNCSRKSGQQVYIYLSISTQEILVNRYNFICPYQGSNSS